MSLTNNALLPALYIGLSTPANSRPPSPPSPPNGFCDGVDLSTGLLGFPALLAKSLLTDTSHAGQTSLVRADPMAPDSLSRSRMGELPVLEHILSVGGGNPLCLAADDRYIYAGVHSASNEINVFSRTSFQLVKKLLGHEGSVLELLHVKEKGWLLSSSSDGTVRIWSTSNLEFLSLITPCYNSSSDIYSLAWDPRGCGTLYMGSQSTDIQFVNFNFGEKSDKSDHDVKVDTRPKQSHHRTSRLDIKGFFSTGSPASGSRPNSPVPSGGSTPRCNERMGEDLPTSIEVPEDNVISSAHYGYIYCLHILTRPDGETWLVSGSGDSDIKIWRCHSSGGLEFLHSFDGDGTAGAVLSLATRDSLLFGGLQGGQIKVWDLETRSCIRTILAQRDDVMSMIPLGTDLYTVAADGQALRFNESFDCSGTFQAHAGAILSAIISVDNRGTLHYVTAGNDSLIKVWKLPHRESSPQTPSEGMIETESGLRVEGDVMLYALAKLVAIPTVSDEAHREQCRQGAHLLRKILMQMGAQAKLVATIEGKNPLVIATFSGKDTEKQRKRVLFYGHYDVQPADKANWDSDPFTLSGRDGYLHGRGVSDDKGPIMAVAAAVAALRDRRELNVDVVMLIEGEEEAGSGGFQETTQRYRDEIGHIDCILLSNSSWIGENDPCIVYGMRGVIYARLEIHSDRDDAHSGVDGGAVDEPMSAMIRLLGAIGTLSLPGFFDDVLAENEQEREVYKAVAAVAGTSEKSLESKWRKPTFSVANIVTSASNNNTIIPREVTANVSFRLVPNQNVDRIVESFQTFCNETFDALGTDMSLNVHVPHRAGWWLASPENEFFRTMEGAVKTVWDQQPLRIREGGSIPSIPFLEKLFEAPCVHLPLGQHSSAAHLRNERLRMLNLRNGKRVIEEFLVQVGKV